MDSPLVNQRECMECGCQFGPRSNEIPSAFRRRRYCGRICANRARGKAQRQDIADKICPVCDVRFAKRTDETRENWSSRQSCSLKCAGVLRRRALSRSYLAETAMEPMNTGAFATEDCERRAASVLDRLQHRIDFITGRLMPPTNPDGGSFYAPAYAQRRQSHG